MRTFAIIYAIIFLLFGIYGFIDNDLLFGAFHTNLWLNILHLVTGLFALWVIFVSLKWSRLYFQVTGIVYALIAICGFIYMQRPIFSLFASNMYDTWFHIVMAVPALILGFGGKKNG